MAFHAIYECGLAQGVWEASKLEPYLPRGCCSMVDWWTKGFKDLREEEVGLILTTCWVIWSARCKASMEGEFGNPILDLGVCPENV